MHPTLNLDQQQILHDNLDHTLFSWSKQAGGRHHWVPEPAAALGKERHKTLPGKARALDIG